MRNVRKCDGMSYETRYAAIKRRAFDERSNSANSAAWRIKHQAACEKANAEMQVRFPDITTENAKQAIEYQCERIDFHMNTPQ